MKTAIVGGGASGFFLAVNLKEMMPQMEVSIIERSHRVLAKVEVSGGGRCNCTNSFAGVTDLSKVYPRGHRLMKRLFKQFGPRDAYQWFERHGVRLTTQADQCVFPASQDSHAIINCFLNEAHRHHINICAGVRVGTIADLLHDYDYVCVCTGGQPRMAGLQWLSDVGHEIVQPVPSLFTLSIADKALCGLMGTVVENVNIGIAGTKMRAEGSLLITHWGVSGPAVLRLSSYAARYLSENAYQVPLTVNWTGLRESEVFRLLQNIADQHPMKQLSSVRPCDLPARLWEYLLKKTLGERSQSRWHGVNYKELNRLTNALVNDICHTSGRATFRDEFVTCGGVSLSSVNPSTLESRFVPHLFFSGEVLDIDGVTGGFNFQAAWTTAFVVASAIAHQ
ncbi:MAG: aminoacetone oxidase family FAD-binding enzyme [Prevotella sp.]|nr:aminoacetone oxidase family FAD-binding enzyme [Prevotella sp.]